MGRWEAPSGHPGDHHAHEARQPRPRPQPRPHPLDGLLAGIAEGGEVGVSPERLVALVDAARAIAQSARAKLIDADDSDEESNAGLAREYHEQDEESDGYTGSAQEWADRRSDLHDLWRREI